MRTVHVDLGERSYPIYIGTGLLPQAGSFLVKHGLSVKSPHLIVTDDKVAPHHLDTLKSTLEKAGFRLVVSVVKSGESSKSLQVFEEVMTSAIQGGLDRKSSVIALGGGVVGDLAGFVAATYMRGIAFIQMPTTVLAHDSSVGGKVAVNHPLAKNMIGAFHQPEFVLYDLDTLMTLPPREVSAGLAEMVKHGSSGMPHLPTGAETMRRNCFRSTGKRSGTVSNAGWPSRRRWCPRTSAKAVCGPY
ncbi:3-dehydroquinate synthase [Paenibacillus sp. P1XP2]|nr:3-dehydroquinate synthase [Paenibacillus sp. P1XP2]